MLVDDRVTIATPEGVDVELVLAGLGSRFLARFLDSLIQLAIIIALTIVDAVVGSGSESGWVIAITIIASFLVRRTALPWHIRTYLSGQLLQRVGPRLIGAPGDAHPEFLLEGIVVAKQSRR